MKITAPHPQIIYHLKIVMQMLNLRWELIINFITSISLKKVTGL